MASVTTSTAALQQICGWEIEEKDKGKDLVIDWGFQGRVVAFRKDVPEAGYLYIDIDRETWLNKDLPALREANELEDEDFDC